MDEDIIFWKWVNPSYIGIITAKCVYHWHIEGTGGPKKIFDRHSSLENCQIINYKCNSDLSWCFLVGIYAKDQGVGGTIQLFSQSKSASQIIDGHAAAFADLLMKSEYSTYTVKLFCFASRASTSLSKVMTAAPISLATHCANRPYRRISCIPKGFVRHFLPNRCSW